MTISSAYLIAALLLLFAGAAGAQTPVFPVSLSPESAQRLKRTYQPILDRTEEEMVALIPDRSGLRFTGCPHCDQGAQEGQITWDISSPNEVYCRFCEIRYPNDRYPDDQVLRVKNPVGEIQEYPYWEDPDGYRHYFQARGWYQARTYFMNAAYALARSYSTTGDQTCARRAALILHRFAEVACQRDQ